MSDRWRYACPKGHRSLKLFHRTDTYRCKTCRRTYDGDPVDLKREEVPAS